MKNSFKLLEARKGSATLQGCLFPILEHFSSSGWDHYTITFHGFRRWRAWFGLHYSVLFRRVLYEYHHVFRSWFDFYYPTRDAGRDGKPLDHWALLCGCTSWVRSIPSSSDWASRSPERVGIAYLVCFACFCHFLLYFYSLFISPVCFPRNNKKEHFPFIIIRHELCFPLTHNPVMKYSAYYLGNFYISLYLLSYEYVHAIYLIFLYICSAL